VRSQFVPQVLFLLSLSPLAQHDHPTFACPRPPSGMNGNGSSAMSMAMSSSTSDRFHHPRRLAVHPEEASSWAASSSVSPTMAILLS
jgi:hypothetical protein